MPSAPEHDGLVRALFASATGESSWFSTLQRFAESFRCSKAFIQMNDERVQPIGSEMYGYTPEFAQEFYSSDCYRHDPRLPYYRSVAPGQVYYDHALYDVEEMQKDQWCRNSCDALGTKYQLGAMLKLPSGLSATMTLMSTPEEGHASQSDISAFQRLAPFIEQACSLGQLIERNATTQAALLRAMEDKADGVILLDRRALPVFMNDAARTILAADDGLSYDNSMLFAARGPETRKLHRMIKACLSENAAQMPQHERELLVSRRSGARPYIVRVMPAPLSENFLSGRSIACAMHIHDLSARRLPSKRLLATVFGLSEREADLAVALMRCMSLADAAGQTGMALNTARNHLYSIFRKCAVGTQAELMELIGRLP